MARAHITVVTRHRFPIFSYGSMINEWTNRRQWKNIIGQAALCGWR